MEMQRQSLAVQIGLDLILDVGFRHHDATEVARGAAAFATPHAHRYGPPQHCKGQARRPRLLYRGFSIEGGRPAHRFLSVLADRWLPAALLSFANYALTAHPAASGLTGSRSCFGSLNADHPGGVDTLVGSAAGDIDSRPAPGAEWGRRAPTAPLEANMENGPIVLASPVVSANVSPSKL
jgi:hypothetical protein